MNSCERSPRHSQRRKEKALHHADISGDPDPKRLGVEPQYKPLTPPERYLIRENDLPDPMSSLQHTLARIGQLENERVEELRELVQQEMQMTDMLDIGNSPHPDIENWVNQAEYLIQERSEVLAALGESMSSLRLALQLKKQACQ